MAKKAAALSNSLRDRILKSSTIADTSILSESKFFQRDFIQTSIPGINIALSGDVDGGLLHGLTMIAGVSKNYKTGFALLMCKAFLEKYKDEDPIILFYDSEFGAPQSYFSSHGIPLDSVVHTPVTDVEQLKHDMMNQLSQLTETDRVMICLDSVGNLASKKETDDALEGKTSVDMTRAKALKSLFRMITPYLTIKKIPMICINHTYKTLEMYSKDVVGGGTGSYYGASDIWILGRQQDKDKNKELAGFNFIINIEKSRTVREKSKIPITISFKDGIKKWSGLFDIALELGCIVNENASSYKLPSSDEIFKRAEVEDSSQFWNMMFENTDFKQKVKEHYQLFSEGASAIADDEVNV